MEWPFKDDKLLAAGPDWQLNACINSFRASMNQIAYGYLQGANAICHAVADGKATLDCVIYPIVFLYRQYMELMIKDIIKCARELESEEATFPGHHKLAGLWVEAKRRLRQHYGDETPKELEHLDSCIADFGKHDPDSMAFRYPASKEGEPYLQGLTHVNVAVIYDTMERVSSLLECLHTDLSMKLDAVREMRSDCT